METEEIVNQIKSLMQQLKAQGFTEEDIDLMLSASDESRLTIDRRGNLIFDNLTARIKLTPMERTLYMFLLRYPEGVPVEDLYMYFDELVEIYMTVTVFDDREASLDAVGALVDDSRTTLYSNVSRIKRKLIGTLGVRGAAPYIIQRSGDIYRIPVNRSLVSVLSR